jgi:hypothetical protein
MHTLLDLRGNIPAFIHISDGKLADVNVLDYCRTLQSQMAGRVILQVDKTAFKNQAFYGYKRECRKDSNLVGDLNIRTDCHC